MVEYLSPKILYHKINNLNNIKTAVYGCFLLL